MIEIAIITAPRKSRTIKRSVQYLRRAGFNDEITVFSEPDDSSQPIPGTYWIMNGSKYGCFKNYTQALTYLVHNSELDYIAVFSDDFEWNKNTHKILKRELINNPDCAYIASYTPRGMSKLIPDKGFHNINEGWGVAWGGNYVFKKETAKIILEHPIYIDHYENYEKNQQIDHLIPKVCKELGLDQVYRNPSLSNHIGYNSTIGHVHSLREQGLNFSK